MINDQPTDEHWLTYAEAAERLGLTVNAVRALARRQRWPRRSPNVIGGQAWVAVPTDRLPIDRRSERAAINGHNHGERRVDPAVINDQPPVINSHGIVIGDHTSSDRKSKQHLANTQSSPINRHDHEVINDHDRSERRPDAVAINDHTESDQRSGEADDWRATAILAAVEKITEPLREQITDLKNQLAAEKLLRAEDKARADRADQRVRALEEKLEAEIEAHRQVVAELIARIPTRRSWLLPHLWRR